ncbi:PAS domain-containing protein [Candidatus Bipolaricaulota bacterium]|nr:PAS domain-containing protein [Candidatus Bipolaricaulota bacterium]
MNGIANNPDFPVVGIGASAGGLKAIKGLLSEVPESSEEEVAFVIIQHMDPDHESVMASLLEEVTDMEVRAIEDGMEIEPNCVYINPPRKKIGISDLQFRTSEFETKDVPKLPIDYFLRALSEELAEKAVGVVLSGSNADGSTGLKAIKGGGGMTIAQEESQAQYREMPRSAINTGFVDYVLPVEEMADKVFDYARHPYLDTSTEAAVGDKQFEDVLPEIFKLIRERTGHDFTNYKTTTIRRRIERRMAVGQMESIGRYHQFLRESRTEAEELFKDLLITVTNFFREPETFASLKEAVLPDLLDDRPRDSSFRIWVPGCSTGEEAYSIAMVLREVMEERKDALDIQLFATDLDSESIETARRGVYPETVTPDISEERLDRFFLKEGGEYKISDPIRRMVVFAQHDLIEDPPLSGMDLISCRNVLIYMNRKLHRKVLPLFHYSLNDDGILLLGDSESPGEFTDLFEAVDGKKSVLRRKSNPPDRGVTHPEFPFTGRGEYGVEETEAGEEKSPDVRELAEEKILESYSQSAALIDENYEIHYFHGNTERYLVPPEGKPSMNILEMARGDLRYKLSGAVSEASKGDSPAKREGVTVEYNGEVATLDLIVDPVGRSSHSVDLFMVVFQEKGTEQSPEGPEETKKHPKEPTEPTEEADRRVEALEKELKETKGSLQATIEELETSNEELKSRNEELQATNEELQSTNEELQTAREEAQSSNEELTTVNQELKEKIDELSRAKDDMKNLLDSTEIAILFLDTDLGVRRFTPETTELFNLIESDLGRPLTDVSSRIAEDGIIEDMNNVLDTLQEVNREIRTEEGDWYEMEVMPYRTTENVVDGLVVTFKDITRIKRERLKKLRRLATVLEDSNDAMTVYDLDGSIQEWNSGAEKTYGYTETEAKEMNIRDLVPESETRGKGSLLEEARSGELPESLETKRVTKEGRVLDIWLTMTALTDESGEVYAVATTERDISDFKQKEKTYKEEISELKSKLQNTENVDKPGVEEND